MSETNTMDEELRPTAGRPAIDVYIPQSSSCIQAAAVLSWLRRIVLALPFCLDPSSAVST